MTYPSCLRGPPYSAFRHHRLSYLFSPLSAHESGSVDAPRPRLVRVGEPCVVYDPRRRISAFPHVDGLLARCSISRFPRLAVYRISTRTFTFRTLMRCFTSPSSSLFLPPPFSGLFHVTSVLLLHCSPYTNAQKHTENPQKTPHMTYSPFSRFLPFTSRISWFPSRTPHTPTRVRTYVGRAGRAILPQPPPHPPPSLAFIARPHDEATLLSFCPLSPFAPVALLRQPLIP
ncbi:hypothetical protein GY45DRAFT_312935 [Cubamyces sp. BRFM 1775]|nr:hypothetical protein GY45DRAFT_312935 [Cubamyces sp. BRFM 1775]